MTDSLLFHSLTVRRWCCQRRHYNWYTKIQYFLNKKVLPRTENKHKIQFHVNKSGHRNQRSTIIFGSFDKKTRLMTHRSHTNYNLTKMSVLFPKITFHAFASEKLNNPHSIISFQVNFIWYVDLLYVFRISFESLFCHAGPFLDVFLLFILVQFNKNWQADFHGKTSIGILSWL